MRFYRDHVDSSDHCIRNREDFLQTSAASAKSI